MAVGVPLVEDLEGDDAGAVGLAGDCTDGVGEVGGEGLVAEEGVVLGVLDEGAVVVDLVGVEAEVVVDLEGGAGRAGGGKDDLDAALADLFNGLDSLEAEAVVGGEEGAVEVKGNEVEASPPPGSPAPGRRVGSGRSGVVRALQGLGAEASVAEFLVEVELFGGDGSFSVEDWQGIGLSGTGYANESVG